MSIDVTHAASAGSDVADSRPMGWAARLGLTARAVIYLVMGWLAIVLARGDSAHVDQRGVLVTVLSKPFGTLLVVVLLVGFLAYAAWRFSEAAFGVLGEPPGAGPRLTSFGRGLAYLAVAWSAFEILRGVRRPRGHHDQRAGDGEDQPAAHRADSPEPHHRGAQPRRE